MEKSDDGGGEDRRGANAVYQRQKHERREEKKRTSEDALGPARYREHKRKGVSFELMIRPGVEESTPGEDDRENVPARS